MKRIGLGAASALALAALVGLIPGSALGQGPGEDFVTGSGTGSNLAFPELFLHFEVAARSGPTGENASGMVSEDSPIRPPTFNVAGPVTCLAVEGNRATVNFRSASSVIHTRTYIDGLPGDPTRDGFVTSSNIRAAGDCSPIESGLANSFLTAGIVVHDAPPLPTSKDQCKNGGWRSFGVFKNQGDCVSFVATGGKNPPSGP